MLRQHRRWAVWYAAILAASAGVLGWNAREPIARERSLAPATSHRVEAECVPLLARERAAELPAGISGGAGSRHDVREAVEKPREADAAYVRQQVPACRLAKQHAWVHPGPSRGADTPISLRLAPSPNEGPALWIRAADRTWQPLRAEGLAPHAPAGGDLEIRIENLAEEDRGCVHLYSGEADVPVACSGILTRPAVVFDGLSPGRYEMTFETWPFERQGALASAEVEVRSGGIATRVLVSTLPAPAPSVSVVGHVEMEAWVAERLALGTHPVRLSLQPEDPELEHVRRNLLRREVDLALPGPDGSVAGCLEFDLGRAPLGTYRLDLAPLGESWSVTVGPQGLSPSYLRCTPPAETWLEFRLGDGELVLPDTVRVRLANGDTSTWVTCEEDPLERGYHVLSAPGDLTVSFQDERLTAPPERIRVESGWNLVRVEVSRGVRFDLSLEENGVPIDPGRAYWSDVVIEPAGGSGSVLSRGSFARLGGSASRLVLRVAAGASYRGIFPSLPDGRVPAPVDLDARQEGPRSIRVAVDRGSRR